MYVAVTMSAHLRLNVINTSSTGGPKMSQNKKGSFHWKMGTVPNSSQIPQKRPPFPYCLVVVPTSAEGSRGE